MVSAGWLPGSPPRSRGDHGRVSDTKEPVFSSRKHLPQRTAAGITSENTCVTLRSLAHSRGTINVSFSSFLAESELNIM